ncbi:MAG: NADH-ubiquinone oxidoreductase-F iron-sulfur binding region domain-containing protein [Ilumatobacteraceae bacterium]
MTVLISRVLDERPVPSLAEYVSGGGGAGLEAARRLGVAATIEEVVASGLRGRGGAGFPTGEKWRTVAANASEVQPATVIVNGAEGEPGSFKDRTLLVRNPYRVLEGALIAASAVGADHVIVAVKESFAAPIERVRAAFAEVRDAGWAEGVDLDLVGGPGEYLFGEETALLEVTEGRPAFPRVAPPYRHGADELGDGDRSAATVELAGEDTTNAPPTLANNVETLAHVPLILANGATWFREVGTADSPGTIVCTVSGATRRADVGEVPMGTPLRAVIDEIGGGPRSAAPLVAVLSGVSHPFLPAAAFDTPLSFEALDAAGGGLGAAGFIVVDQSDDVVAVAQGVARFLAVESCGQCTPCKQDGAAIAEILGRFCASNATDHDVDELSSRIDTVADEARCFLAQQQQRVANSLLALFPEALARHLEGAPERAEPVTPVLIAPLTGIRDDVAELDETQRSKQPDWTYDETDSGASPAERLTAG